MPLYDYECKSCGNQQEEFFKIDDKPDSVTCHKCMGIADKVLSSGMVLGDDMPEWMRHPHVLGCLQNQTERPISTRGEYNQYLKKHNIIESSMNEAG